MTDIMNTNRKHEQLAISIPQGMGVCYWVAFSRTNSIIDMKGSCRD